MAQTVFSSSSAASPFTAAPPPPAPAVDPPALSGSEAVAVVEYLTKLLAEGETITAALLKSIVEKVSAGVVLAASQLAPQRIPVTAATARRQQIATYFGLVP